MFSISVCMIVKNEEKVIERILNCAIKFADEIIIVDTGSTDKTKSIARKFTNKIFDFKWENDFSKARNFSFSKATCDYQMWLDADDIIQPSEIEKILKLKSNYDKDIDVYMLPYSIIENGRSVMKFYRERLLKREDNFVWNGFVHETIFAGGKIKYLDIEIEHQKLEISDPKRNLKLYENAIKNKIKFTNRDFYYYARELFYNNKISKCIYYLNKFLKFENNFFADIIGAQILLSQCFLSQNDLKKSLNILFECLKTSQPTSEMCCKIAHIFELKNEKERAVFWYKTALQCPKQDFGFVSEEYSNIIPYIELSKLLYQTGKFERARYYHNLAKNIAPNHPSILYNNQFFNYP